MPVILVRIVKQVSLGILPTGNPAALLSVKCQANAG